MNNEEGFECEQTDIPPPPHGMRFRLVIDGEPYQAFLVKPEGAARPRAFYNRCAHMALELDWNPGLFFDRGNRFLVCATHGALFEPDSGRCVAGPCAGASLVSLPVSLRNGRVRVEPPREVGGR